MSDQENDLQFNNGDEQFNDHQQLLNQEGREEGHEENHMDVYRDEGDYDLNQSFEQDQDSLIKVKAKVMFNINKERQLEQIPILYQDLTLTSIAMQYASSIKNGSIDEAYLQKLNEKQRFHMEYLTCQIVSKYEEDIPITKKFTENFFIESAYVFFQMDNEKEILMDSFYTHVGIGLAGNGTSIAVVLLITRKDLAITEIVEIEEDKVQVRGKILSQSQYVYLADVYDNKFNQIASSLYDRIQYNRTTKDFIIKLDVKTIWNEKKWIQIFTSGTQPIGMRKPPNTLDKKKKLKKDLNDKFLSLFFLYPDPRYIEFYNEEVEAQANKQANLSGMLLESLHKQPQMKQQERQESQSQNQEEMQEESDSENDEENKEEAEKEQKTSNKEIKEELQMAIGEAKNAYDNVVYQNIKLQGKIKQLRQKHGITLDKIGQGSMNEHKYLNILAQVHQTRMELQLTQERYNRMSMELQSKLQEKQMKCNDIRGAFQDLKKEVAKKATYSRSDQPIKQNKIQQWQQRQSKLSEQLQNLRLQILRARNALAKNQKILKKKEQLAEGLHLIDFEQLKIENQTLNQRIQERNQDLHKLKKKTTTMVQILTHTRQKLVYVQKMKVKLLSTNQDLDKTIQGYRGEINSSKQQCEKLRLEIQDAKQDVEIVNSQQLVVDFKKRNQFISKLEEEMKQMKEREKQMKSVIEMYQRKIRKQAIIR